MKNFIILPIILPLIIFIGIEKNNNILTVEKDTTDLMDENLFRNEIRNTAIEAAKEFGIDPDSTYIPFREKKNKIEQ